MKTAVSIPDAIFFQADALAAKLGKSRSELVTDALREHLLRHGDAAITERLNAVYDTSQDEAENAAILNAYISESNRDDTW